MKLQYIKANGVYYKPQEPGVQDPDKIEGCHLPVCRIKRLLFGRWRIDYHDKAVYHKNNEFVGFGDEDKPNTRVIIYPKGIEEIRWEY